MKSAPDVLAVARRVQSVPPVLPGHHRSRAWRSVESTRGTLLLRQQDPSTPTSPPARPFDPYFSASKTPRPPLSPPTRPVDIPCLRQQDPPTPSSPPARLLAQSCLRQQDPPTPSSPPARPFAQCCPGEQYPPTPHASGHKPHLRQLKPDPRNRANQGSRLFFLTRRMRATTVMPSFGGRNHGSDLELLECQ